MALYKFVKQFGNKKAGESYPLLPVAAKALLKKGIVELSDGSKKPKVKTPKVKVEKVKTKKKK